LFGNAWKSRAEKLAKRTMYKLDLNKDKFINECIKEINELLLYRKIKAEYFILERFLLFPCTNKNHDIVCHSSYINAC